MIEVLTAGALNSIQDRGRVGWLASGVSRSGAMDRPALDAANALVGNAPSAAGIEVAAFPFRLRFLKDAVVAVTGAIGAASLSGHRLPPWWGVAVKGGDVLTLDPPTFGARAYVAVAGGIDVAVVLGARASELKSGFGGLEGRGLRRGDVLPVGAPTGRSGWPTAGIGALPPPGRLDPAAPVRVLPAAEWGAFGDDARRLFVDSAWSVTAAIDRQGCRLDGPELRRDRPRELLSHGIVPGTVQVPPAGRPIVQLSEANTCGGYAKIATVIEADLWRLGQAMPGDRVTFEVVPRDTAVAALRAAADWLATLASAVALYSAA